VAVDSYCEQNPKGHWSLRVGVETLAAKLKEYFKAPGLSSLSGLNIAKAGFLNIETLWANQEKKAIAAQDMRAVLGYDKLRSPSFSIKKQGEEYVFEGRGFGHGVGLCQWGARALGKNGAKFDEILMHYYPKAEIKANNRFRLANTKTTSLPELRSAEESSVITEIK
jgi:stage II sporulation protein D